MYFLQNENKSYIGFTVNLERRLKQHRRILKGGAKATGLYRDVRKTEVVAFISGFPTKNQALSFEYHCKHRSKDAVKRSFGALTHRRLPQFFEALSHPKFEDLPLTIHLTPRSEVIRPILQELYVNEIL